METTTDASVLEQELYQERQLRLEFETELEIARDKIEELNGQMESHMEKLESMETELHEADRRQNSLESALFTAINNADSSSTKTETLLSSYGQEEESFDGLNYVSCSSIDSPPVSPRKRSSDSDGNRSCNLNGPSVQSEYLEYVKAKLAREERRGLELEDKLKELMEKYQEKEFEWQQKEGEIEREMERCKEKLKEEREMKEVLSSESDKRAVEYKHSIQHRDAMIIKLKQVVETESEKANCAGTELKQYNSLLHKRELTIVQLQNQLNDAINKISTLQDQIQELQEKHKRDIQKFVDTMRRQRAQLDEVRMCASWSPYGSASCMAYRSRLSLQIQQGLEHFLYLKPPGHDESRIDLEPEWE